MAKKTKSTQTKTLKTSKFQNLQSFLNNRQTHTVFGIFLMLFSLFLTIAFFSFFFSWKADQSALNEFGNHAIEVQNLLGKIGANLSHFFIYNGFGVAAFVLPILLFLTGVYFLFKVPIRKTFKTWNWGILIMLWFSISFGFMPKKLILFAGIIGVEINEYLQLFLGKTGLVLVLTFLALTYVIVRFKVTPERVIKKLQNRKKEKAENNVSASAPIKKPFVEKELSQEDKAIKDKKLETSEFELSVKNLQPTINNHSEVHQQKEAEHCLLYTSPSPRDS